MLHRRAAAWFRAAGNVGEAISQAAAAGDIGDAVDLVAEHGNAWFNAGRLATVDSWLDRLPAAAQLADPRLCVAQAWLLLDAGRLDDVDRWLTAADTATNPADAVALRDIAVLCAVHRFKIGDVGARHAAARRVLELNRGRVGLPRADPHREWGGRRHAAGGRGSAEPSRRARRRGAFRHRTAAAGAGPCAGGDRPGRAGRRGRGQGSYSWRAGVPALATRLLYRKLGASSRAEAVQHARQIGLLDAPHSGQPVTEGRRAASFCPD